MRTNIEIDDELMDSVMRTGEFKTKREAVEAGLRAIVRRKAHEDIRALRGKVRWDDSANPDPAWEMPRPAPASKQAAKPRPSRRAATAQSPA